jgi:glycosyltransferase involved in cell wall biosynthesis
MRSLIISPHSLLPLEDNVWGAPKRLLMYARAIAHISTNLEFLFIVPAGRLQRCSGNYPELDALAAYCHCPTTARFVPTKKRTETFWKHYIAGITDVTEQPAFYPYSGPDQAEAVGRHLDQLPDLVFVSRLSAMAAVLRSRRKPQRMFFDLDDVEHKSQLRLALEPPIWPGKLAYTAHLPAIWIAEHHGSRLSRATFVCSEKDRRHLRRLGFGQRVTVMPNAVQIPTSPPPIVKEPTVLFLGTYLYRPNVAGAERLIRCIWPRVQRAVPDAMLLIAGQGPENLPSFGRPPTGVVFAGFVSDLESLYARSRVVVCPLTAGGGTRIKLIEAASYAKPMVSTRVGAEGLSFVDGKEILLHEDDASFADSCVRLLHDDRLCAALGTAARTRAVALYDVVRVQQQIIDAIRSAM